MKKENDTIIAPLTPSIGGSISVIRISGNKAIQITDSFIKDKNLSEISGGSFIHASFRDNEKQLIDDVVLLIYRNPNSFTGEDVIEINCHANPFVVDKIISLYLKNGCRYAEPGEFSKRAFLNGKLDLVQAEAIADLISAKSQMAVDNSLSQLKGRLSKKILEIKKEIINIISYLELDLDFSEEELEIIPSEKVKNFINNSETKIFKLLNTFKEGKIISKGIDILITGKPNVGKSSLMNTLLGQDRVIVSDIPGTTRDIIHEQTIINNVIVRFLDSAGIHLTQDSIEAEGIERAREYFNKADLILMVFDNSVELTYEDLNLIKSLKSTLKQKMILVANKSDKQVVVENKNKLEPYKIPLVNVSAKIEENIDFLKEEIINTMNINSDILSDEILITNRRQYDYLEKTIDALKNAYKSLENNNGYEFVALDMRAAINHLSEITGEISTDDILNNIFSSFCIGK